MTGKRLVYLGPEGTFTHQAAMDAVRALASVSGGSPATLEAAGDVPTIMRAVETEGAWGVIAWENNVEGYVVPNLDALIDSRDAVGFARFSVDITFDAFTRPSGKLCPTSSCHPERNLLSSSHPERSEAEPKDLSFQSPNGQSDAASSGNVASVAGLQGAHVYAHSHGLAQCKRFIAEHGLLPEAASSNAAACRDLEPGQVALGPRICGDLYHLDTLARDVQDFAGARTDFLVLAPRAEAAQLLEQARNRDMREYETIITFIPLSTGPGVLANLLDVLRDAGLNMTSFISRPIKGHAGTYSFIVTLDAAPWQDQFRSVLAEVAEHGDWVKTLAVYPRQERPNPPVDAWMLPEGGVHLDAAGLPSGWQNEPVVRRELMW